MRARRSAVVASILLVMMGRSALAGEETSEDFPKLPLPPVIEELFGLPAPFPKGRALYLDLVSREAERQGLPAAVADAVTQVESAYTPGAVGAVGEIGLMQVRPSTATMLGHRGGMTELFHPEINLRLGIAYLAKAWQLTSGDLCRALMKYRAGHGEERMTPASVEYCRRARLHLAAIGSPLAHAPLPTASVDTGPPVPPARPSAVASSASRPGAALQALATATRSGHKSTLRRGSSIAAARRPRTPADSRRFWAAHEARIKAIMARVNPSRLRIISGS